MNYFSRRRRYLFLESSKRENRPQTQNDSSTFSSRVHSSIRPIVPRKCHWNTKKTFRTLSQSRKKERRRSRKCFTRLVVYPPSIYYLPFSWRAISTDATKELHVASSLLFERRVRNCTEPALRLKSASIFFTCKTKKCTVRFPKSGKLSRPYQLCWGCYCKHGRETDPLQSGLLMLPTQYETTLMAKLLRCGKFFYK